MYINMKKYTEMAVFPIFSSFSSADVSIGWHLWDIDRSLCEIHEQY